MQTRGKVSFIGLAGARDSRLALTRNKKTRCQELKMGIGRSTAPCSVNFKFKEKTKSRVQQFLLQRLRSNLVSGNVIQLCSRWSLIGGLQVWLADWQRKYIPWRYYPGIISCITSITNVPMNKLKQFCCLVNCEIAMEILICNFWPVSGFSSSLNLFLMFYMLQCKIENWIVPGSECHGGLKNIKYLQLINCGSAEKVRQNIPMIVFSFSRLCSRWVKKKWKDLRLKIKGFFSLGS